MSPLMLLLVLLVVAYIGGHWAAAPGKRAFGTASGVEYVVLGVVLGPQGLGLLDEAVLGAFDPVSLVALGWIALGYGVEVGAVGDQGVQRGPVLCGLALTGLVTLSVGACVGWLAHPLYPHAETVDFMLLCAGVGLVSAQSARDAVVWVAERYGATGTLTRWLVDFSRADDVPVLVALSFLFALFHPLQSWRGVDVAPPIMGLVSLVVGALLGLLAAWLFEHSASRVERWTILLGSALLATGATESLGLSAMGACFALGMCLSLRVKETDQIREKLASTEGPVLLPALLLAGAHLSPPTRVAEWWILAFATVARVSVTLLAGQLLGVALRRGRAVVPSFSFALLSSGTLSVIVGFALLLRFPGEAGRLALSAAFVGTLLGELIGAPALRRSLTAAGELSATPQTVPPPAPISPEVAS
jgi:Kef-type K+ transport system membrane component KefB